MALIFFQLLWSSSKHWMTTFCMHLYCSEDECLWSKKNQLYYWLNNALLLSKCYWVKVSILFPPGFRISSMSTCRTFTDCIAPVEHFDQITKPPSDEISPFDLWHYSITSYFRFHSNLLSQIFIWFNVEFHNSESSVFARWWVRHFPNNKSTVYFKHLTFMTLGLVKISLVWTASYIAHLGEFRPLNW